MSAPLAPHALLDCAALARELGISRTAAEAFMRRLPKVRPDSVRKVYVRWADVAAYVAAMTEDAA